MLMNRVTVFVFFIRMGMHNDIPVDYVRVIKETCTCKECKEQGKQKIA